MAIETVSGSLKELPAEGAGTVRPAHRAILTQVPQGPGPHIVTGPIAVRGAVPGDALRIDILDIKLATTGATS